MVGVGFHQQHVRCGVEVAVGEVPFVDESDGAVTVENAPIVALRDMQGQRTRHVAVLIPGGVELGFAVGEGEFLAGLRIV